MPGPSGIKKCVICLKRRFPKSNVFLTKFPLDPDRCRLWVKAVGIEDLAYLPIEKLHQLKFICGAHFSQECFNKQGNRLKQNAIPNINLPNMPLTDEILKDFPLHIKKVQMQPAPKYGPLTMCTNTVECRYNISCPSTNVSSGKENVEASTSKAPENLTHKRVAEEIPMSQLVPLASTSKAPENLTYKRVAEEIPTSPLVPLASTSKALENLTYKRVAEDIRTSQLVPLASTSKAPENLTYKRVADPSASNERFEDTITVQRYKRAKFNAQAEGKSPPMNTREKRLFEKLQNAKVSLKNLATTSINLDNIDSDTLKSIVINAVKNQKKKPQGKRWGLKNKFSALAIFKRSPKTYRFMTRLLPLPSEKTLQRMLKNVPVEPGIYKNILVNMSEKFSEMQNDRNRYCCLLFDEMTLKKRLLYNKSSDKVEGFVDLGPGEGMERTNKVADHALVFMLQGICLKYKQPIAHYFVEGTISSQQLASIIKDIIRNVSDAGLTVITTVCDQGPTNVGALNLLKSLDGLHKDINYFMVDSKKILIMYDIPHLFKSIRNNFYNAGLIKYDGRLGQWSHLKAAEERNRSFLNFKKLTPLVVNPNYKIKMKVKYAAHALSNTMAAVLKMMAWKDDDAEVISETAYVIEQLDRLFDCTNGPASPKDKKTGIRENVSEKTNHIATWNSYLKTIETIQFINSSTNKESRNVRCVKGFQISLSSLKDIWDILHKAGFKYLNLRQLNQDSLENLFGNIRQHGVTNKNPTCSHFTAALKTSIITGLTGPQSRGANCEADSNKLFINYKEIDKSIETESFYKCEIQLPDDIDAYPVLSLPDSDLEFYETNLYSFEDQPVVYVSGYLAAKLLSKSTCMDCKTNLSVVNPDENDELYNYISFREWWQDKKSLTYPSKKLCETVDEAKQFYEAQLSHEIHKLNIAQECVLQLRLNCYFEWFSCVLHSKEVTESLIQTLSYLFIGKSCKIINDKLIMTESDLAAKDKMRQQMGKGE